MSSVERNETATQAVVLLSGGLDSVAALFWACRHYADVRAIAFRYGQPAHDAELVSAGRAADACGVKLAILTLADALALHVGLMVGAPAHDPEHLGIDRANVPGRNVVFLSLAAAHGSVWFKGGNVHLIVGCNADDAAGFPDCRYSFLSRMGAAVTHGCSRPFFVVAPWINMTKGKIVANASIDPRALSAVLASWSCYRREGPCGECGACVKRAAALAEHGLVDGCTRPAMFGGDPAREAR